MERAGAVEIETPALPTVPPRIMAALLDAADSIMYAAILDKWSPPPQVLRWDELERLRMGLERYPWPTTIGD
jgi:hypothetical protein